MKNLNKYLIISIIIAVLLISGSVFYYYVIFLPKTERIKLEKEEQKQLIKEQQDKEEKQEEFKESLEEQLKKQEKKEFEAWVVDCIIKAQNERDRRKQLIINIWLICINDGILSSKECDELKDYSIIEKYYEEWEKNCERGIENIFPRE